MCNKKILIYPKIIPWYFSEILDGNDPNIPPGVISLLLGKNIDIKELEAGKVERIYPKYSTSRRDIEDLLKQIKNEHFDIAITLTEAVKESEWCYDEFFLKMSAGRKYEYNFNRSLKALTFSSLINRISRHLLRLLGKYLDFCSSLALLVILMAGAFIYRSIRDIFSSLRGN